MSEELVDDIGDFWQATHQNLDGLDHQWQVIQEQAEIGQRKRHMYLSQVQGQHTVIQHPLSNSNRFTVRLWCEKQYFRQNAIKYCAIQIFSELVEYIKCEIGIMMQAKRNLEAQRLHRWWQPDWDKWGHEVGTCEWAAQCISKMFRLWRLLATWSHF